MKIYTRGGDDGTTGLFGGQRVPKCEPRIDCYGTVDELNASIGLAAVGAADPLQDPLRAIQEDLFTVGAVLASPGDAASVPAVQDAWTERLERQIDAMEAELPPLRHFILPGGSEPAARLHAARTVCRRAERLVVAFAVEHPLPPPLLRYLNRLSDWLFVAARLANRHAGVDDVPWVAPRA